MFVKNKIYALIAAGTIMLACSCGNNKIGERVHLSWWVYPFSHVSKTSSNFAENEMYRELMRRLNVDIEFIHPSGRVDLNLLKSSANLPDLIEGDMTAFLGGPQRAIDEGFIISLDPYLEKYSPNYSRILQENRDWDKEVTTSDGTHYTYAWIRGDESLLYWTGPIVRSDLLDLAGLSVPQTIEEWEEALMTFKQMNIEYPLSFSGVACNSFLGAFNVGKDFYQIDGIVKFAPMEDGYRDYITVMKRWYDYGLLDTEFFVQNAAVVEDKVKNAKVGAFVGALGSNMGNCIPYLKQIGAELAGAPFPTMHKGDEAIFGEKDYFYFADTSVSISGNCKNIEAAARLLDYGYSDEGHMLYNFGIEGVSYNMVDGYPKYTELITNNPDGLSMQFAMSMYMASAYGGPFIQDKREYEQYIPYPEQKQAIKEWSRSQGKQIIPRGAIAYDNENLSARIISYCEQQSVRFITGERPIEQYGQFKDELITMGINDIIEAKQEALELYNNK